MQGILESFEVCEDIHEEYVVWSWKRLPKFWRHAVLPRKLIVATSFSGWCGPLGGGGIEQMWLCLARIGVAAVVLFLAVALLEVAR